MYKCQKCGMEFDLWSSAYCLVHRCSDGKNKPCQDTREDDEPNETFMINGLK